MSRRIRLPLGLVTLLSFVLSQSGVELHGAESAPAAATWKSLLTPAELHARLEEPNLLILDVRAAEEYAQEHIPGAINLPGSAWRTPATQKPAVEGAGSLVFRTASGELDVARYEQLLSAAGVTPEKDLVVYGNYAGKADGSVPAAILLKLGHARVTFLDGVGLTQWKAAGYETSKIARKLPPATYKAPKPAPERLWSRADVLKNLHNKDVIFLDSRSAAEYAGSDLRRNKRGGHIPGAISVDEAQFLDAQSKTTIPLATAKDKLSAAGASPEKTIVIYCQTGTRCSHKELILKDLGYKNVVLYDASWQDWGNQDDTPIETKPIEK